MPTVEEYTDPFVTTYVPPPALREGVCRVCHGAAERLGAATLDRCDSCELTRRQVTNPLDLVVPIVLCGRYEQVHDVLRGYKDSPDSRVRQRHGMQVAALIARFLRDHGDCIRRAAGSTWDALTIVPSTNGRPDGHPLERAVCAAAANRPLYLPLLERTDVQIRHRTADERAYRVIDAAGRSVLLIDDTFTSGARVQSCASALTLGGAHVVAAVVVGRFVNPDYSDDVRSLWDGQTAIPFDFDRCCLE